MILIGIMKEGRLVMERTREELQYEDLVKIYIDYMKSEPEMRPEGPEAPKDMASPGQQ